MNLEQERAVQELQDCARRLGRTPTQAHFKADSDTRMSTREIVRLWPGGWREALGAAGLKPGWDNQSLLDSLKRLATQLGRVPTARDINASREAPSAAIYIQRFGSLREARQEAGLTGIDKNSDQAMVQLGVQMAVQLGRLPGWNDWVKACREDNNLPSQWQVYRRFGGDAGAWKIFQYCLIEEAAQQGIELSW